MKPPETVNTRSATHCTAQASPGSRQSTLPTLRRSHGKRMTLPLLGQTHRAAVLAVLALVVGVGLVQTSRAANGADTWKGGSVTNLNTNNWTGANTTPVSGDNFIFNTAGQTLTNDLAQLFTVAGFSFNTGAGAFTFGGNTITLTGGITNNVAALQTFNNAFVLGTNVTFSNALSTGAITLSGPISGGYGITASGLGAITLSGSNSYSGGTTVAFSSNAANDSLILANSNAAGTGTITVLATGGGNAGNTLGITSGLTITNALVLGGGGSQRVNVNNATGSGTATYAGNITVTGASYDFFNRGSTGTLVITGLVTGTNTSTLGTGGVYVSGSAGGTVIFSNNITLGSNTVFGTLDSTAVATLWGSNTFGTFDLHNGGTVNINNAYALGSSTLTMTNGTGGVTINNTSGSAITLAGTNNQIWSNAITFGGGANLTFGAGTITMQTNITVTVNSNTLTEGGNIGSSAFTLTKAGAGVLALSGSNAYTGQSIVSGGALDFLTTNALYGGNTTSWTATNMVASNGATVAFGVTNFGNATIQTLLTTLTSSNGAGILSGGSFGLDATGTNYTFTNNLANGTNGALGLTALGTGTVTLSGTNSYTGGTTIGTGGTLQLSGLLGSGSYAGAIVNNGSFLESANTNQTLSGVISGSGSLTQSGPGILTLSGSNSYTGGTTISGGTLALGNANALGSTSGSLNVAAGILTNASYNVTLGAVTLGNGSITGAGTLTGSFYTATNTGAALVSESLAGSGATFTQSGAGTTTLSGTNSYSGGTTLNAGTIALGTSSALGTGAVSVASNATISALTSLTITNSYSIASGATATFKQASASTVFTNSGVISGSGSLTQSGPGILTLSGSNSYTGGTIVGGGVLDFLTTNALYGGNTNSWTAANLTVSNGGTAAFGVTNFGNANIQTLLTTLTSSNGAGILSGGSIGLDATGTNYSFTNNLANGANGTLGFTALGTGTVTLSGSNSYSGTTTVGGGVLEFLTTNALYGGNTASWTAGNVTVASNAMLALGVGTATGSFTTSTVTTFLSNLTNNASGGGFRAGSYLGFDPTGRTNTPITLTNVIGDSAAGALGLAVFGDGNVILAASNSFSGGMVISNTTGSAYEIDGFTLANNNAAGTGTISLLSGGGNYGPVLALSNGVTISNALVMNSGAGRNLLVNLGSTTATYAGNITITNPNSYSINSFNRAGNGTLLVTGAINGTTGTALGYGITAFNTIFSNNITLNTNANFDAQGGIVTLWGSNTFGTLDVNGVGTLNLNNAQALGSSSLVMKTANVVLDNTSGSAITIATTNNQTWSNNFTFGGSSALTFGAGTITLATNITVTVNGNTLTEGGNIGSSAFTLTKAGAGVLALSGSNAYTGQSIVSGGALDFVTTNALYGGNTNSWTATNMVASNGATVAFGVTNFGNANIQTLLTTLTSSNGAGLLSNASIGLDATGTNYSFTNNLANGTNGALGLTALGTGTLTLSGSNAYTGGTTIYGGRLVMGGANSLGASTGALNIFGGTLDMGAFNDTSGAFTIGSGTIAFSSGGGTITATSFTASNIASVNLSNSLAGSGAFTKNGSGTTTLSGSNSYTGVTTVRAGTLVITGTNNVGTINVNSNSTLLVTNGILTGSGTITLGSSGAGTSTMTMAGTAAWTNTATNSALTVASAANSASVLNIKDSALLNLNTTNSGTAGNLNIGSSSSSSGVVNQSGGSVTVDNALYLGTGSSAYGFYNLSGGTLNATAISGSGSRFRIGGPGGQGLFWQSGGTILVTNNSIGYGLTINGAATSNAVSGYGAYYATGGTLLMSTSASPLYSLNVGSVNGLGVLTLAGTATITIQNNLVGVGGYGISDTNATGIVNLNGGLLTANSINGGVGQSYVNFAGGTLQAYTNSSTFLTNLTRVTIGGAYSSGGINYAGGATIDVNGMGVTIAQALTAPTGNGVVFNTNSTPFTPITGLIGAPVVQVVGGGGTGATAQAVYSNGVMTGITITSPGSGYTSAPSFLISGGGMTGTNTNTLNASLVANTGGALIITNSSGTPGTLTLSGSNSYSGGTTISGGTLALGNANALGTGTLTLGGGGSLDSVVANLTNSGNNALSITNNFTFVGTQNLNLGTGSITLATNITVTVNGNTLTAGGNIGSSAFTLTKAGAGVLALSGSNAYSGGTVLNAGTIALGTNNALGTGTVSVASNATISALTSLIITNSYSIASGATATFTQASASTAFTNSGVISGSGSLTQSGTGTLTLSGTNSYTGGTTISGGTLQLSGLLGSGSYAGAIVNNGSFLESANTNQTLSGVISGNGALTQRGTGTLILSGSNSYSGGTTISGGTLALGNANALGTGTLTLGGGGSLDSVVANLTNSGNNALSITNNFTFVGTQNLNLGTGSITLATNITVTVNGNTLTAGGNIGSSAFTLTKAGAGVLALSGSNSYTGGTTVSGGTLAFTGTNTFSAGNITVGGAGTNSTLNVSGALTATNSTLTVGTAANDRALAVISTNATVVTVSMGTASNASGALYVTGGTFTEKNTGAAAFVVGNSSGGYGYLGVTGGQILAAGETVIGGRGNSGTGVMDILGGTVTVTNGVAPYFNLGRGTGATSVLNITGGTLLTAAGVYNQINQYAANSLINIGAGGTYNMGSTAFTFGGGGGTFTMTLNGGTLITGGLNTSGSTTSTLNFNGGTFKAGGASTTLLQGLTNAFVGSGGGTIDNGGFAVTVGQNLLAPSNSGISSITLSSGGSGYIGAPAVTISGGGGSGATAIAMIDTNPASVTYGQVTNIQVTAAGSGYTSTPTITLSGGGYTSAATLSATNLGTVTSGGMTFAGTGTTTLSGSNSYSGGTILNAGTIALGNSYALGTGAVSVASNATISALTSLIITNNYSIASGATATFTQASASTAFTNSGVISGSGSLTQSGPGTLTLSGSNSYTGGTTISGGTLALGNANALGSTSGSLNVAAGILTNASYNVTLGAVTLGNGSITGAGTLTGSSYTATNTGAALVSESLAGAGATFTQNGPGTLTLSGTNTYTGGTTIGTGATLQLSGLLGSGSYAGAIVNNGSFLESANTNQTLSGVISGSGSLTQSGPGILTLSGSNSYSGGTTVNGGTLLLGNANALGASTNSLAVNGGSVDLAGYNIAIGALSGSGSAVVTNSSGSASLSVGNGNASSTYSGTLAGSGLSLVKAGSGTFTLTQMPTYGGTTAINAGTLSYQLGDSGTYSAANNPTGNGNLSVSAGAINLSGTTTLGGSQSYVQTVQDGTYAIAVSGVTTIKGSSITLNGDVGATNAGGNSLTLDTSSNNGTINLNISLGYAINATNQLDGFTANAGTGSITVSGTGSASGGAYAWYATPVTLTGAVTITAPISMGYAPDGSTGTSTLTINATGNSLVSGALSDYDTDGNSMALVKGGSSTLTLSGANSYTGATVVNSGTLQLNGTNTASAVSVNDGATLSGTGSAGAVTVKNGATITSLGTLTVTGLTFNTGSTFLWNGSGTGLSSTGGIAFDSGSFIIDINTASSAFATATNYVLMSSVSGISNFNASAFTIVGLNGSTNDLIGHFSIGTNGTSLYLFYSTSTNVWGGGSGNLSTIGITNNSPLILSGAGGNVTNDATVTSLSGITFSNGVTGQVTLSGSAVTNGSGGIVNNAGYSNAVTLGLALGADQTFKAASNALSIGGAVDNQGHTLTVDGSSNTTLSNVVSGAGGLTKVGAGTLFLASNNTYAGATLISNGVLQVGTGGAAGSLGSGAVTNNASLVVNRSDASTLANDITVSSGQSGTVANAGTGSLTLSGTLTKDGSTLTLMGGSAGVAVTGAIVGSSPHSDLIIDGGTTTLSHSNSYNGPTYIRDGATLNASVAYALPTANGPSAVIMDDTGSGASTLALGANQTIASLAGASSSTVVLGSSTLTVGTTAGNTNFSGTITGTGGLSKIGASTLTLAGNSTYSGGTTINAGTLGLSGGTLSNSAVTVASGATLTGSGHVGSLIDNGSVFLDSNNILSADSAVFNAASTLTMTAVGTNAGSFSQLNATTITLNGGTLEIVVNGSFNNTTQQGIFQMFQANSFTGVNQTGGFTSVMLDYNGTNKALTYYSANETWQYWDTTSLAGGATQQNYYAGLNLSTGIVTVIPEPSSLVLFSFGTMAAIYVARRRRNDD